MARRLRGWRPPPLGPRARVSATLVLVAVLLDIGVDYGVDVPLTLLAGFGVAYRALEPERDHVAYAAVLLAAGLAWAGFPQQSNHANVSAVLLAAAAVYRTARGARSDADWERFFRLSAAVIYASAGFHKLNTDFLWEPTSCAAFFAERLAVRNGVAAALVQGWPPAMFSLPVVALELGIAALLLRRRTFKVAFVLCTLLHVPIAFAGVEDFGAVMFAVVLAGAPIGVHERLWRSRWHLAGVAAMALVQSISGHVTEVRMLLREPATHLVSGSAFAIGAGLLVHAVLSARVEPTPAPRFARWQLLGACLIALWTVQPYVGLSNAGTLTMFSNLSTRRGQSNHLLVPDGPKPFELEEDAYLLTDLEADYRFQRGVDLVGRYVPRAVLHRMVHEWTNGGRRPVRGAWYREGVHTGPGDLRELVLSVEAHWYDSLLVFRTSPPDGPRTCEW